MSDMKVKLNWPEDDVGLPDSDLNWDCKSVVGLRKLMADGLHLCFRNAVKKIAENGFPEPVAEFVILKSGPYFGSKDMVSVIVDRSLNSLRTKGCHDSKFYIFQDLNALVEFMILEMVTMLREVKPSLSVRESLWTLLICDLNVIHASEAELDSMKFLVDGEKGVQETETPSDSGPRNQETSASDVKKQDSVTKSSKWKRIDDKCSCCRKWCSGNPAHHKKDVTAREKAFRLEKPYKGRMTKKALKEKLAAWGDLVSEKKNPPPESSSGNKKNPGSKKGPAKAAPIAAPPVPAIPAPEPPKIAEYYLSSIPYDDSVGEYMPDHFKDTILLAAVDQLLMLQNEIRRWDDWANAKVMQVAKRLSHDRPELNKLRAEKEEAEKSTKDKQAMEENTVKRLSEMTTALNNANYQIEVASSAIVRLENEKSALKKEMEAAGVRSSVEAKNLEEALRKEAEAIKMSQSFGSEKSLLEEEVKALKREVAPLKRAVEKANDLLSQTKIRLANEEKEAAKVIRKAESMKNERELLEKLANSQDEMVAKKAEKEAQRLENETKRIQYEISAIKLEQETKKIAAMRTGMNWAVSKTDDKKGNLSKKKDRECVMCLTEEMTVVLLPCGHQVLCGDCNVIHEQNGMKECPSCRTPIEKRVNARFAKS
ncbi:hypothetical protein OSB04_020236 [Centaurea solstitialis]|uniref:RING-type domain-containing protein n=1 Tax=Centaurea solstitialis TaxID=347529 RepID=A0AA38SSA9_9ASTR|nr:hypothetical protein OSB04_020236 [Centaurea solstitialis]